MSKKDQFQHNLKKMKRQAVHDRSLKDSTEVLRDLFSDFGNIYVLKPKK